MISIRRIVPKGLGAQFKAAPEAVEKGMREAAEAIQADMEKTTAGWKHEVTFSIDKSGDGYTIGTDDQIWTYQDEGTRPHVILPRRARVLRFEVGGDLVFAHRVNHPGTKARLFTKQLQKSWQRGVVPFIRAALEEHFK